MRRPLKLLGVILLLAGVGLGIMAVSQRAPKPVAPPATLPSVAPSPTPTGPLTLKVPDDFFIEQLRTRPYSAGPITQLKQLADSPRFTTYQISYPSDGLTITGLLNVPKGDGPFPAIILNHGYYPTTTYRQGDGTKREMDYLADRGYLTLAPDYRNYAGSTRYPDAVVARPAYPIDVISAGEALKNDNRVQPDRLGLWGHSMGGGITLKVLAIKPNDYKAAVVYGSMSANEVDNYNRIANVWNRPYGAEFAQRFGTPESSPSNYAKMSASSYYDDFATPVAIHHGTADAQVPFQWSVELREALQDRNKPIEFYAYPGAPHSFAGAAWNEFMTRVSAFYDARLKR